MNQPVEPAAERQLIRALGVPSLTANIVNSTVGAGILPFRRSSRRSSERARRSPFSFARWRMAIFVTSFALAGSRVSLTGGLYAYVETAFGRYVGFIAGVLYFLTAILASSGIVALFADTIGAMAPIFAHGAMHFLVVLLRLRRARLDQYPGRSIRRPRRLDRDHRQAGSALHFRRGRNIFRQADRCPNDRLAGCPAVSAAECSCFSLRSSELKSRSCRAAK